MPKGRGILAAPGLFGRPKQDGGQDLLVPKSDSEMASRKMMSQGRVAKPGCGADAAKVMRRCIRAVCLWRMRTSAKQINYHMWWPKR
jgi:hypothetical protein